MACDFGDDEDDPDSVLDLCELVALLLIPHLRKIQESDKGKQDELFGRVLKLILEDVMGKAELNMFWIRASCVKSLNPTASLMLPMN
jgi:hypothetical protein